MSAARSLLKRGLIGVVFALYIGLLAWSFQGHRGVWQPDEGYYVGTAITMEKNGEYLIPRICNEIFLDKPPLLYWGILWGMQWFGHTEFALRFFSGLCYALTCGLVYWLGVRVGSGRKAGIWAAVIYATMILPFTAANFITMDTTLTLFTTLSMLAFWESVRPRSTHSTFWKMVLCTAMGTAFLTKGPAALIPAAGMFIYLVLKKRVISYFASPWTLGGLLIFMLSGLGWYVYIAVKLPGAASYFWDNQLWGRLISSKYQRNPGLSGAMIYLPILLLGTLPWSVDWFRLPKGLIRFKKIPGWKALFSETEGLFLACWILVPMGILCLASSKLGLYALPVFPAIALATVRLRSGPQKESAPCFNRKTVIFLGLWSLILLGSRFILAEYPVANDSRSLWNELQAYVPAGDYEIVAVDERVDGLIFYGGAEVETITRRKNPYPTYMIPETIEIELQDMIQDRFPHLYILEKSKHLEEIKETLAPSGWCIHEITLKYHRKLLLCDPLSEQASAL